MPTRSKDVDLDVAPDPTPAPPPAPPPAPVIPEPNLRDLYDEFESLKAHGNPNPARLAELKKIIAGGTK